MGRVPCCEKDNVKRGQWTPEEDNKLSSYIAQHGTRNWRLIPKNAGLQRCGKSCRLRWTNYLRPDLKHGQFTDPEEQTIVKLHAVVGNRWSLIAAQLPGRTDNDVKNYWNTKLKKKLSGMGIDPVTHKPFSHLMAEIATTLAPPQVAHLAEAALGCFKDEMLHLLTKKRPSTSLDHTNTSNHHQMIPHHHNLIHHQQGNNMNNNNNQYNIMQHDKDIDTVERIKLGLSRAITDDHHQQQQQQQHHNLMMMVPNGSNHQHHHHFNDEEDDGVDDFPGSMSGFQYGQTSCVNNGGEDGSPWDQSICSGSTSTTVGVGDQMGHLKLEENGDQEETDQDKDNNDIAGNGKNGTTSNNSLFGSESVLWDLPSDELIV